MSTDARGAQDGAQNAGAQPSTAENPWPVRTVARKIADWIHRLGSVWVEGQITQISARPGTQTAFLTLRDPAADVSMSVTCQQRMLRSIDPPLREGASVVVHARPSFWLGRGTLSLRASEIRAVGIGELLARIERLRKLLAAEGLFAQERKRPLPFLPRGIGLITGRASAAEHDVLANAQNRWPAVKFHVVNTAVQGAKAVPQVVQALSDLDANPEVDVIVIARGGGSVEDLLPFSDETLCRAVAAAGTPVVSAIGHEPDSPLLDNVADVRCSTPTGAAKTIVPDVGEETARVHQLRDRARRALHGWVDGQRRQLDQLRSRPCLADPLGPVERREADAAMHVERARRAVMTTLTHEQSALTAARARLTALGPSATLERGYAVVQYVDPDGQLKVLRSVDEVTEGTELRVRVTDGAISATTR
ncbi:MULTISPECIES: exodeoxyribonuclease VII large subunit [Prauserella salsuginis group]|uniref:Exodeoxyribonuclease 7 large subunit n=2 Tax=Prauserella salsuginis group TaxID=2893672 RepID=A0A839XMD2_9PSEU|nr:MULTISPECIES: exodeoxyribonuclease VII large subunit [Prauserella salsuginis group]MBB3663797.1 exodeoxyribonuclease VII large subunit [Prauserella sediminis]MCR3722424.1 Exodeoxyribonuclease VII large subunit [Prauserella flava]MCR3736866.1 Exodeoxyribonuclease VII large subunit [Prauserella salsuginis]